MKVLVTLTPYAAQALDAVLADGRPRLTGRASPSWGRSALISALIERHAKDLGGLAGELGVGLAREG
jgi:hypothetical protein